MITPGTSFLHKANPGQDLCFALELFVWLARPKALVSAGEVSEDF